MKKFDRIKRTCDDAVLTKGGMTGLLKSSCGGLGFEMVTDNNSTSKPILNIRVLNDEL